METIVKKPQSSSLTPLDIRYDTRWFKNFYDTNQCFKIYNSVIKPLTIFAHNIRKQTVIYESNGKLKIKQLPFETSFEMKVFEYNVIFSYDIDKDIFSVAVCRGNEMIYIEDFNPTYQFFTISKYKSIYRLSGCSSMYYSIYNLGSKDGQEWSLLATDVINKTFLLETAKSFEERQKIVNSNKPSYDRDFKLYYKAYKGSLVGVSISRDIDLGSNGVVRC